MSKPPSSTSSPEEPSSTLVRGLQDGDPAAWERLVHFYAPIVGRWARRAGLQDADGDNVVQEVFRRVAQHVRTFRRDQASGSFLAWLSTITRTQTADHYNRRDCQPDSLGGSDFRKRLEQQPAPADDSSSSEGGASEQRLLLRRVLDVVRGEFEPRTWQAFWATAIGGRETAEVAADLGMTGGAVRTARSRVLRRVREVFGEMAG